MKPRNTFLAAIFGMAALSMASQTASAQPGGAKATWDNKGWVLLGQKVVNGKKDRDVIPVGRREGTFTKLMVVVEDSDLEMTDMVVFFGNGEKESPTVRQFFKETSRTRAIDLPGAQRQIKRIEFRYGNVPGGGRAKVEVWGKEGDPGVVPGGGPGGDDLRKAAWDRNGWEMLGKKVVQGKRDRDVLMVGGKQGAFSKLMVVVEDSDLEMTDMQIVFGNGEKFDPKVKQFFKEKDRTRAIDLPGNVRNIKRVEFRYGNLPGGGKASVEVWGREGGGDVPAGGGEPSEPPTGHRPRGPLSVVLDFFPRSGPPGTVVRVVGRRFAPDVAVMISKEERVVPTAHDEGMLTFVMPKRAGKALLTLNRPGREDLPIGVFQYTNKNVANERVRLRARWRTDAEKWWKLRERELAKTDAERKAAFEAAEAKWAAERDKRREARLLKIRAAWQADLLSREEARIELALNAERTARLDRMLRLAEAAAQGQLAVRVRILMDTETARHDLRMADLKAAIAIQ